MKTTSDNNIYKIIQDLEIELATLSNRNSIDFLSEVIHDDFEEIGNSGRVYKKEDILNQSTNYKNDYELIDFTFKQLAKNCILVKYLTTSNDTKALRSSIWKNEKGNWQILHHQATIIN